MHKRNLTFILPGPRLPIVILILFSFCASCGRQHKADANTEATLYPPPLTAQLNLQKGYQQNVVTGDTIRPLINFRGDTIKTGILIPAKGKVIPSDSVLPPMRVVAGSPSFERVNTNTFGIPGNPVPIVIDQSMLRKVSFGKGDSLAVVVNSVGDTISTGKAIQVMARQVNSAQPGSQAALPMRMKDAANSNMQYLDVEQGMNSAFVLSIIEDQRGNIWFGTRGGGATRYDGKTFTHFTVKEGLSSIMILRVLEDSKGRLWFASEDKGVTCYDGTGFFHFTETEGLPKNSIQSMLEDKSGNMWFGSGGGGVTKYDGDNFTHFSTKEGLSDNYVHSILEDGQGSLWFGTRNGVCSFDGKLFTHYTVKDGLCHDKIISSMKDRDGNLWFGSEGGGVSRFADNTFTNYTEKDSLRSGIVTSILEDKNGIIWFGTKGGGVTSLAGDNLLTRFTETTGLANDKVLSIMEDKSGNLWFGTDGGGVSKFDGNGIRHYTAREGLTSSAVMGMAEDKNGDLWFATLAGGVAKHDDNRFSYYTTQHGLVNDKVLSVIQDRQGHFWMGTSLGGACKYDGKYFYHFTEKNGLSNNSVYTIYEDRKGNLWFGTRGGGVSKYDGSQFTHYTEKEGLSSNTVYTILEDEKGNMWFGTKGGGVSKYDGNGFMHFTEKEGLSDNVVFSTLQDSKGNLWFGTLGGGATMFDGDRFTYYTSREGLSNNIIFSILEDKNHTFWMTTENGLNCLVFDTTNISDQKSTTTEHAPAAKIISFQKQEGLRSVDFYLNSAFVDSKNNAWWGSNKSLLKLDLQKFSIPNDPPTVALRQLDINEAFLDYRETMHAKDRDFTFDSVVLFENYPANPVFPYFKNHLTFHYIGFDWAAPHKIKYRYRLAGLNENWSSHTDEIKAEYRNLPAGIYTFQVQAIGVAQRWSNPMEYGFTINPPWWKTWWAYTAYLLLGFFFIMAFARYRSRHLKEQNVVLEKKVAERTTQLQKSLEELKSAQAQLIQSEKLASLGALTAGIAHEIQNPLNFVKNFAELNSELIAEMKEEIQQEKLQDVKSLAENIDLNEQKIIFHSKRADAIVKSMLQHSRASTGIKEAVDINELADEYLRLAYHGLRAKNKNINAVIQTNFDETTGTLNIIPQDIGRVLLNLFTNAFYAVTEKSAKADPGYEPTVAVVTKKILSPGKPDVILISVRDNGNGIPENILDKIFQPFFTTKPTGQGTGLGLSLAYDIIKSHGGKISVDTIPGEGTSFIIQIPIQ